MALKVDPGYYGMGPYETTSITQAQLNQYATAQKQAVGGLYGISGTGVAKQAPPAPPMPKCTSCQEDLHLNKTPIYMAGGAMVCDRTQELEAKRTNEKIELHKAKKRKLYLRNRK